MSSDVCKHCTHAGCLDVCPTGSLFRTEFGTVVVQDDICNGCGYCVPACPFGVIDRRIGEGRRRRGIAQKCTLCYDRLGAGQTPACAQACPTESIQFGDVDELRERAAAPGGGAARRRGERGPAVRRGSGATASAARGAFFLLLDEPEVYGLPPDPVVTTGPAGDVAAAVAAGRHPADGAALSFGPSMVRPDQAWLHDRASRTLADR